MNKVCYVCKLEKPISSFNINRLNKDGHQSYCAECYKKHYKHNVRISLGKRLCAVCFKKFAPRQKRSKYCSSKCSSYARSHKDLLVNDNYAVLPSKAWVGAEEMECVVL